MRNIIYTIILVSTIQFGYSVGGVGIYGVHDLGTIEGFSGAVDFEDSFNNLVRDEISSPIGLGGYFYLDVVPIVDIEIGCDIAYALYDYEYIHAVTQDALDQILADPDYVPHISGSLPWVKTSYYISVQKPIVKVPMFKLYGGIGYRGTNSYIFVSDDLLFDLMEGIDSNTQEISSTKLKEAFKDNISSQGGFMIETGARFKPAFLPFSLNAKIQHNFIKDIFTNKDSYTTILFGLGLAL